jgi:hypothetical protein
MVFSFNSFWLQQAVYADDSTSCAEGPDAIASLQ